MEERVLISLLIDFYGALLTERQLQCLQLHHEDDLSLAEIADQLGGSRQAVHDNLQRALQLLHSYEDRLHLVAQYEKREQLIDQMKAELNAATINKAAMNHLLAQMEG